MPALDLAGQHRLVEALLRACASGDAQARLIETHISWVLLAGEQAWKIKKALDLGFLDYSSLALREHACREELRLNRRTAPDIYQGLARITGSMEAPQIDGPGETLEYAVCMRRFDPDCGLDVQAARGLLGPDDAAALGRMIARFHQDAEADREGRHGLPAQVLAPVVENFAVLRPLVAPAQAELLDGLEAWARREHERLAPLMRDRAAHGRVRECHGDLHLGNLLRENGRIVAFDCIEFAPELRWMDVASDLAFTLMDLRHRGLDSLARIALNAWLEVTGDFGAAALLPWHQAYRAMVRAKVAALRSHQTDDPAARARPEADVAAHLLLALRFTAPPAPLLVITCGVSGSGKSRLAAALAAERDWVVLRADVERKRLAGLAPLDRAAPAERERLYAREVTVQVYERLATLAEDLLRGGSGVIVDATFLGASQRAALCEAARRIGVPFAILSVSAPPGTLRQRVAARAAAGSDASDATLEVLAVQQARMEAIVGPQSHHVVAVDTATAIDPQALARRIEAAARVPG